MTAKPNLLENLAKRCLDSKTYFNECFLNDDSDAKCKYRGYKFIDYSKKEFPLGRPYFPCNRKEKEENERPAIKGYGGWNPPV